MIPAGTSRAFHPRAHGGFRFYWEKSLLGPEKYGRSHVSITCESLNVSVSVELRGTFFLIVCGLCKPLWFVPAKKQEL